MSLPSIQSIKDGSQMPDRAVNEIMPVQLEMWSDYATPACNRVRAKNNPPEADADGFFDAAGVTEICGRRQCSVTFAT